MTCSHWKFQPFSFSSASFPSMNSLHTEDDLLCLNAFLVVSFAECLWTWDDWTICQCSMKSDELIVVETGGISLGSGKLMSMIYYRLACLLSSFYPETMEEPMSCFCFMQHSIHATMQTTCTLEINIACSQNSRLTTYPGKTHFIFLW